MINRRAQLLGIRNQHDFDVFDIKDMLDDFQHIDGVIGAAAVEFVDKQDNRFVRCQFFQAGFERLQIFSASICSFNKASTVASIVSSMEWLAIVVAASVTVDAAFLLLAHHL